MSPRDTSTRQIVVVCPACQKRLYLSADDAGRRMACAKCYQAFVVPEASQTPAPSASKRTGPSTKRDKNAPTAVLAADVDYIPVVCGLCHTRMYVTRDKIGSKTQCPDCHTYTLVKKPEARPAPKKKRPDVGGYGVRQEQAVATSEEQELVPFFCRLCHTRMHAPKSQIGRPVTCPDCDTTTIVPRPDPHARKKTATDLVEGEYDMGQQVATAPLPRRMVQPDAIENPEPLAEIPRWTFFSGVFTYAWHREALVRWVYLSLGLIVIGLLASVMASLIVGDKMAVVAMGFLAIPMLWIKVWTYSFGCACFGAILSDTADGLDEVLDWPPTDWREWLIPLIQTLFVMMTAGGIGYCIGLLLERMDVDIWVPVAVAMLILPPFLLLSSLETNSMLSPFSQPILRSLVTLWWGWLLYYILAAVPLVFLAAVAWGSLQGGYFVAAILVGPTVAAVAFIEARLLGRLAWRASLSSPPGGDDES